MTSPLFFMDASDGIGLQQFKTSTYFDEDNTDCVSEENATLERTPFGAGCRMREVLCKYKCVITSVMWNNAPTFFGLKGHRSTIDFVAIPHPLHMVSSGGGPLRKLGRKLQLPRTLQQLDHVPTFATFQYCIPSKRCPAPKCSPEAKLDKEMLMEGAMQCKGRRDLMSVMEAAMASFLNSEAEDLLNQATPDEYFARLDAIAIEVGSKHFNPQDRYCEHEAKYDEWRRLRLSLLAKRRELRGEVGEAMDKDLIAVAINVQKELDQVSAKCKSARIQLHAKREQALLDEIWETWGCRNFAEAFRLCRKLVHSKLGPRKRVYGQLANDRIVSDEWATHLALPGSEGGMQCKVVQWDEMLATHTEIAEEHGRGEADCNNTEDAREDLKRVACYLAKCPKRKACGAGAVPPELLLQMLWSNWRLGFEPPSFGKSETTSNRTTFLSSGLLVPNSSDVHPRGETCGSVSEGHEARVEPEARCFFCGEASGSCECDACAKSGRGFDDQCEEEFNQICCHSCGEDMERCRCHHEENEYITALRSGDTFSMFPRGIGGFANSQDNEAAGLMLECTRCGELLPSCMCGTVTGGGLGRLQTITISSESDSDNSSIESYLFSVDSAYFEECNSDDCEGELTLGVSLEKGAEAFILLPPRIEAGDPCQVTSTNPSNTSTASFATGHAAQPNGSAPAPAVKVTVATLCSSGATVLASGSHHSHNTAFNDESGMPAAAGLRAAKTAQGDAEADAAVVRAAGLGAAGLTAECETKSNERSRISHKDLGQVSAPPKAVSRSAAQGNVFCSGVSPSLSFLSPAVRPDAAPREALGCPSQGNPNL